MTPALRRVASGVGRFGGAALVRAAARIGRRPGRALVLMYHRVSSEPDYLGLCVSPHHFERQLDTLARTMRVVPLATLAARVAEDQPLACDLAAITFDDGYRDNLEIALPILQRHGLPSTVFVTVDFVDGCRRPVGERLRDAMTSLWKRRTTAAIWPETGNAQVDSFGLMALGRPGSLAHLAQLAFSLTDLPWETVETLLGSLDEQAGVHGRSSTRMLDWPGVRALAANDVEIGSHALSHGILSRMGRAEAEAELLGSKSRLEQEIGTEVRGFAYPNGRACDFTDVDVQGLRRAGYAYACTTERGTNTPGDDPYRLARLGAGDYSGGIFDLRLAVGR